MTEIGTRVWAVRDATDEVVNAYGFGTFQPRLKQHPNPSDPRECIARMREILAEIAKTDSASTAKEADGA